MPESVRFLGRRVYVDLIVLLLPVLAGDASPTAASAACRRLGLSRQTLRRWRRWWQETLAGSAVWRAHRGRLRPSVEVSGLPRGLLDAFRKGWLLGRAVRALLFLRDGMLFTILEGGSARPRYPQKMRLS